MDSLFKKMASRVTGQDKTAQDPMMGGMPPGGGMPIDPMMMGGDPAMMGGAPMGGGAPAPSAEELMAMAGGMAAPAAPPVPQEPAPAPIEEGPDETEVATADALSNMSEAIKNLTDAFVEGKASPEEAIMGVADEMMNTPVGDLAPEDITPMLEVDEV